MVRLIRPVVEYERSYRDLLEDWGTDEPRVPFPLDFPNEDFPALIERLENDSRGVALDDGFVPHSTFWLMADDDEIAAVSNLRHELNDHLLRHGGHIGYGVRPSYRRQGFATKLLELTLLEAKKVGIERALLTCSKENPPSAKVIVANGGVFEDENFLEEVGEIVQRYWIDIP